MKNTRALLLLLLAASVSGCHRSASGPSANDPGATLDPCPDGIVIVEDQPGAPAQLSITKARCEGSAWVAELTLKNVGTKPITGSEIAYIEDYENKKGVSSSQSDNSFTIEPGGSKVLKSGGGFANGLSYGKPVGALKHNTFRITQIQFSDGTSWGQPWTGR